MTETIKFVTEIQRYFISISRISRS